MYAILLIIAFIACASAFAPHRFASKSSTCLFAGDCKEAQKDGKGKCPGEAGYIPILKEAPKDFAAFQAEQKAKKAAAAAKAAEGK